MQNENKCSVRLSRRIYYTGKMMIKGLSCFYCEQEIRQRLQSEIDLLRSANKLLEDQVIEVNGKYIRLKNKIFEAQKNLKI